MNGSILTEAAIKTKYIIRNLDPIPAMTQSEQVFVGTYQEAVAKAHAVWRATKRPAHVIDMHLGLWHSVTGNGIARDTNTNSGVPRQQTIAT